MENKNFFAVDLGATSGRTILGSIADGKLTQRELTRFPNNIIQTGGHFYWDIYALYNEIINGLKIVAQEQIKIESIGIDTWGVDFVCIGKDGGVLRTPYCYRDPHTSDAMDEYFKLVDKKEVYRRTGIQFMNFNSLFQLSTMRKNHDSALEAADKVLFMPDALMYMLTGEAVCEYTILSTSQMLNPDTGSAVAAVPAENERFAYLSCGTWSLLGIETKNAIISDESFAKNFTNEGGIEGTTRFLKNICGMWLLERCRKEWKDAPTDINQINRDSLEAEEFACFINPDSPCFANPESMVEAIKNYCRTTGQKVPEGYKEISRCIFESLAMRYRQVMAYLKDFAPFSIDKLHVIGGGTYNSYLMQFTANAVGIPVVCGPVEGTAMGNMLMQAKASGMVEDMFAMRRIVANSVSLQTYMPKDKEKWDSAYEKYLSVYREDI